MSPTITSGAAPTGAALATPATGHRARSPNAAAIRVARAAHSSARARIHSSISHLLTRWQEGAWREADSSHTNPSHAAPLPAFRLLACPIARTGQAVLVTARAR